MEKAKPQSWLFKVALLSISLLIMTAQSVAAAIPDMATTFTHESTSAIDLLTTIPNLGLIIGIFIGNFIVMGIGAKKTVILGLLIILLSGVTPVFANSYWVVFIARLIFGFGIGIYNSLAISLISTFYSGHELSTMMGFQSATQSMGNSLLSFVAGYLLIFNWHQAFGVYALALPVMILFALVIPNKITLTQASNSSKQTTQTKPKQRINLPVVVISIVTFFFYAIFMVVTVKISNLVVSEGAGTASVASVLLGWFTLFSMVIGFCYGFVQKLLKNAVLPVGVLLMVLGFGILGFWMGLAGIVIGISVVGAGFAITVPYIYTVVNTDAPAGSANLASSVMLIATNIGVFVSPILINFLASLTGNSSAIMDMKICAICYIILFVVVLILQRAQSHRQKNVQK